MTVTTELGRFAPIDLAELDRVAALRTRFDLKYVVDEMVVDRLLRELPDQWTVLEIEGVRDFGYSSLYFDDDEYRCFHDHRRRRRLRFKVRSRTYESTAGATLELKTKDGRGRTVKHRLSRSGPHVDLTDFEREWIDERLSETRTAPVALDLRPTLDIEYRRTTLVEPRLGERLTIDLRLNAVRSGESTSLLPAAAVVEWKAGGQNGDTVRSMRRLGLHPVAFSKYCVGLSTATADLDSRFRREADRELSRQRR